VLGGLDEPERRLGGPQSQSIPAKVDHLIRAAPKGILKKRPASYTPMGQTPQTGGGKIGGVFARSASASSVSLKDSLELGKNQAKFRHTEQVRCSLYEY